MCRTPWCYGDCEDCIADQKYEQERDEANAECPYRKDCNWETVHVKQDRCITCSKTFNYP